MIQEAYCSFEVSKLLKEKGFNGLCGACFDPNDKSLNTIYYDTSGGVEPQDWNNLSEREAGKIGLATWYGYISAPTQQMAMYYLRRVHGIFIAINNDDLDFNWQCYDLINRESTLDPKILSESYGGYKHYEKAVEAALKYSLENLI